jgi:hypothetical protein
VLGTGAVALVLLLPDRTHFTGDFIYREWAVRGGVAPRELFPQAFPFDLWLHHTLPTLMRTKISLSANDVARLIGAVEAGVLAILAVELPRAALLEASIGGLATIAVLFGGVLSLMTGYGKAFEEVSLLALAMGVFGVRATVQRRGSVLMAVAFGAAIPLHRASTLLLPAYISAIVAARPRRAELALLVGVPTACFTLVLPALIHSVQAVDLSAGYFGLPQTPGDAVLNITDVANALLFLAPIAVAVAWPRGRLPTILRIGYALPFLLLALAIRHSSQGLFRDWDMFAPGALLLTVVAVCEMPSPERAVRGLAVALVTSTTLLPTVAFLSLQSNTPWGLKRAEAFATEAPVRPADVRARVWTFISARQVELGDYREAARAGREAVHLAPTRYTLTLLAGSERMAGDTTAALATYEKVLQVDPTNTEAWYCVALFSARLGNFERAQHALDQLRGLSVPSVIAAYASDWVARQWSKQHPGDSSLRK